MIVYFNFPTLLMWCAVAFVIGFLACAFVWRKAHKMRLRHEKREADKQARRDANGGLLPEDIGVHANFVPGVKFETRQR